MIDGGAKRNSVGTVPGGRVARPPEYPHVEHDLWWRRPVEERLVAAQRAPPYQALRVVDTGVANASPGRKGSGSQLERGARLRRCAASAQWDLFKEEGHD